MSKLLIDNLKNAEIIKKPFKHTLFKLFDLETNNKLVKNFIEIMQEKKLKNKGKLSKSRFMIILKGDNLNGINYKEGKYDFLKDIEPLNSILIEYKDNIMKELANKYNINKKIIKFNIMLVYDKKQYEIGPHTDNSARSITQVTYIVNQNDLQKKLGLRLYKDKLNRHKENWYQKHYQFDDNFKEVKQVEYYPGSTINFKVSKNSFHGVQKINQDCERMSIQMFIMK